MTADELATAAQYPHCDASILHAPGECRYCDRHPDWQAYRVGAGINFTGHHDVDLAPCPSSHHRDDEGLGWYGNHPRPESGGRPAWVRGEDEAATPFGGPLKTLPPGADLSDVRPGDRAAPPGACDLPPPGWYCTRPAGHDGPCPTRPLPTRAERVLERLFCPGCFCLRFGPGHLIRRMCGVDCRG